ncbi:hypothetical protein DWB84_08930 [Saccharophagus sp. K07]|jgi:chromosome segregation ATPase|uniref:hypothetical protein n=1 Tax=Saccharophagus sp. K07 TaxID=2283636 RepID=UPI001652352A|nr:hypothetical protein [Saccharophagus sp. K07]MBC6905577.1 hypothetical protein [Saccharophagus sp. K07]
MTERRDPIISTLPLDRDESPTQKGKAQAIAQSTRPVPPPVSSRPVVVRSPLGPIALIVALAAAGFAGFLYWQLDQTQQSLQKSASALAAADARIVAADARIAELEKRLALSDDESSQSLTALQVQVKENAGEIRKLWGVANDRNRKAITQLETKVSALEKNFAGVDGKIKTALADVTGELKVLSELVDAQQAVINSADKAYKTQAQTLTNLSNQFDKLDNDLRKKVTSHEEAIKAIDAFRVQVNRELIQLKGG